MMRFTKKEEAIMQEAFMTGRIYTKGGEKETPVEIQEKLKENCEKAIRIMIDEAQKSTKA